MRVLAGAAALLVATAAPAQEAFISNVPYFPTPQSTVDRMLELASVGPDDFVVDLGSGDGRIVITAAKKFGARGLGVEIEASLVSLARYQASRAGVADRAKFVTENLFATDLRPATVLTLYLFRELNLRLRPRILEELRPGARVVAHDWDMGEWEPDVAETIPAPDKPVGIVRESKVFLWYVPARLEGTWRLEAPFGARGAATLALAQRFQRFEGALDHAGRRYPVLEGRARGTAVHFRIADGAFAGDYAGTAAQNEIAGEVARSGATVGAWKAIRR